MTNNKRARLTEGPVARTLVNLTIPMLLGLVGIAAFNLVDTYFVGQLGTAELAAMSFTFPVVMIVGSVAQGLGIGVSAVVSRAIGEKNEHRVKRLTTDGLLLSVLVVAGFVVLGLSTIDLVFRFLGATPEVLVLIEQYMRIWYLGVIAVVIPMVGNSAIRATGDTERGDVGRIRREHHLGSALDLRSWSVPQIGFGRGGPGHRHRKDNYSLCLLVGTQLPRSDDHVCNP